MTIRPEFVELSRAECKEVLARNHVGRIAFRVDRRVEIMPLGYVARDEWIFLRSAYGAKLEAFMKDPFVALEVDEIDGPFDWRSVVVHGTIYLLQMDGGPIENRDARPAIEALRAAMPGAFSPDDPVPERRIIYGLYIQEIAGRMARSGPQSSRARGQRPAPIPRQPGRRPADNF
jgi:uncharacterized protein